MSVDDILNAGFMDDSEEDDGSEPEVCLVLSYVSFFIF
jgi:hypothetical protein